jgi:hypothetical protein
MEGVNRMPVPTVVRRVVQVGLAIALIVPRIGSAQCAGIHEEGRWRNLTTTGEPSYIDVKMLGGCGDEVLNGQETGSSTRYTMRAWVRQSSGQYYGRPLVNAWYRSWKQQQWLRGDVPTGGYVDEMWLHVENRDNRPQLHVYIIHKSLDSKPSAQSEYWFAK